MSKKVVLLQDDRDCTEIMRYILEEEGFEVLSPESDQVLFNNPSDYDLIIIDEYSSGKTGGEICKQLKAADQTCNIPIVLTSAGTGLENLATACKADKYLLKPFDINYFTALIKKLLPPQWCLA